MLLDRLYYNPAIKKLPQEDFSLFKGGWIFYVIHENIDWRKEYH